MSLRSVAKSWLPPALVSWFQYKTGRKLRFSGNPADWMEAVAQSSGYGHADILDQVTRATRAVVNGLALYERDGVLFDDPDYPFAIVAALWRAAAISNRNLEVIDFGGALGSTYRQCRPLLSGISDMRWRVVEQAEFVEIGRREFTTSELSFHVSLEDVPSSSWDQAILASSVLQYIEDPHSILNGFSKLPARHLIIDRTPVSEIHTDRLCVQRVPDHIYAASYPCWILSERQLLDSLSRDWRLLWAFPCSEGEARRDDGLPFTFKGFVLERKP